MIVFRSVVYITKSDLSKAEYSKAAGGCVTVRLFSAAQGHVPPAILHEPDAVRLP